MTTLAVFSGLLLLTLCALPSGAQETKNPVVVITTSAGDITVELDPVRAPTTVKNFLEYVDSGHFDGTIFHRVISGFMIQGGGFTPDLRQKQTKPPIKLEAGNGLSNLRGTIAMARTNDPNSATSQFFINHKDNKQLDTYGGGYAVFGKVTEGIDVVDKIAAVPKATKNGMDDVPVETVTITSIKRKP
jgi:peptidyl-prolyl cis-trans isomerase A (cyclophilin A)